ncbi:MAG: FtsX-like permease family protein [Candidatus Moranbacteria bacterium]|nr:FtsX-like permease family protein [Candidatus Moranbacteria bacterium]
MKLLIPVKISLKNLLASKLRSFLTILGIIIGVAAVIIIFAAGQSAQTLIIDKIQGTGSNIIAVLPGKSEEDGPPAAAFGIETKTLTYKDLEALRDPKQLPQIESGAGFTSGTLTVTYKDIEEAATVQGVTKSYLDVEDTEMARGRFFTKAEEKGLDKICVLGHKIAKDLFGVRDPLQQEIKLKNQKFRVIGILKEKSSGGFGAGGQDETVYLPLKTSQKLVFNIDYLNAIRLKVKNVELLDRAEKNVEEILRIRHDIDDPEEDDFSVRDLASAVDLIRKVTDVIRYFLLAVGSISLLVGGVGIMNIMLISVNQRIREIGLRKAVGARNKDVATQFLIESAAISVAGGLIGILIGILVSFAVYLIANLLGYAWPFIISPLSILVAVLVALMVGVIFGMFPAKKAADISPMEALRYE